MSLKDVHMINMIHITKYKMSENCNALQVKKGVL